MSATNDQQQRFLGELEAHKRILFKVASSYCANPTERQELIQEITAQLWRSYARFDGRSQFSTWMYRVALNVAISFVRDERRRVSRTVALDDAVLEVPAAVTDDNQRLIDELLGRLDALDRALIVLYLDGHDHAHIADILGISPGNVATKINRIKERLRTDVRSHGG
jgi:RNA polymerase sigma factor (sigma-70 family)